MPGISRRVKTINPNLIRKKRDHTLNSFKVSSELLPVILHELVVNKELELARAMNYSRILYNQVFTLELKDLLDTFDELPFGSIDTIVFFGSVDPSTFKNYTYWYSRFLFHVNIFQYHSKYKRVCDIDLDLIITYLYYECRRGLKPDTVRGHLSAIKHMLYPFADIFPFLKNGLVFKKFFQFLFKVFGYPSKKKVQLGYDILTKMLSVIDFDRLKDVRDWFSMIMLHAAGFRAGELAPVMWKDADIDSYTDTYSGREMTVLMLFLDSTKTDNQSIETVVTISCPAEASTFSILHVLYYYIELLAEYGFLNKYMFPSLKKCDKGRDVHISTSTIRHQIKEKYAAIGGNPDDIGAHSGRSGFVTDAIAAGIPVEFIKRTGRWKSECWRGYFRDEQFAQACCTSSLMEFQKGFETRKSSKKNLKFVKKLASKIKMKI